MRISRFVPFSLVALCLLTGCLAAGGTLRARPCIAVEQTNGDQRASAGLNLGDYEMSAGAGAGLCDPLTGKCGIPPPPGLIPSCPDPTKIQVPAPPTFVNIAYNTLLVVGAILGALLLFAALFFVGRTFVRGIRKG